MNFIHPQFFYAAPLLLAAVVILSISATARRRKKLAALLGSSATDPDAVKLSPARRRLRNGCLLLAMLFLVAAAARPFWDSQLVPYEPHGRDLMVLFDVSKSMRATDIAPSRLDHANFCSGSWWRPIPGTGSGWSHLPGTPTWPARSPRTSWRSTSTSMNFPPTQCRSGEPIWSWRSTPR